MTATGAPPAAVPADGIHVGIAGTERRPTYAVAAFVVLAVLWWSFLGGTRVPILGFVDLAVHEAGHVLFLWAPTDMMLAMGNGFQALVPLLFAGAFVLKHRDLAGGAAALAWAAAALQDASVYIADAPYRRLPLLGPESSHDWWQLLGRHGWLDAADELSRLVWVVGLVSWILAVAVLAVGVRWDAVWLDGDPGVVFLPWTREMESRSPVRGVLASPPAVDGRAGRDRLGGQALPADDRYGVDAIFSASDEEWSHDEGR